MSHSDGDAAGRRRAAAARYLALYAALVALAAAYGWHFDAFGNGFSGNDESAHFVNAYFVRTALAGAAFGDPMGYAVDFYIAFPKLSIGHWPPLYYGFVGLLFFVVPASPAAAMVINLFVAVLPALAAAALARIGLAWRWAVLAALVTLAAPVSLILLEFFMLDQPVAFLAVAGAICWHHYARRPGYGLGILYGAIAAAAIMTKGNGWLMGLLPIFHILLGQHWRLLRRVSTYLSAAVAIVAVVPWYLISTKISASGFNYDFGLGYAATALQYNVGVLVENIGLLGLALAAVAVAGIALRRLAGPGERDLVVICLSLLLATLTLQSLVPVALSDRYMAPAIPALAALAALGLSRMLRHPRLARPAGLRYGFIAVALVGLALPGLQRLASAVPQVDLRMDQAATTALAVGAPLAVLIDGLSGGEGAFVAEAAVRAAGRPVYVVRSSKLMSESSFMGDRYALRLHTPAAVDAALAELGIAAIVLERVDNQPYVEHSDLLLRYLESPLSRYVERAALPTRHRHGVTRVFVAAEPVTPDVAAIREVSFPSKAPLTGG